MRYCALTQVKLYHTDQEIQLQQHAYTNVAKIRPLSDFVGIKSNIDKPYHSIYRQ